MNESDIAVFKKNMEKLLSELEDLELTSKASTATVVLDQTSVGRLSRMDAMQGQQMALESERRRKMQVLQIKAALKRVEKNEFGYCLKCGEKIFMGRLNINPAATCCIECAQ